MTTTEQRLRNELAPGERLLWTGHPPTGLRPDVGLAVVVLFVLVWTGLILNAIRKQLTDGGTSSDLVVPALMILVGAAILLFLVVVEPRGRNTTVYGLTDRRAIILAGQFRLTRNVDSLPLHAMTNISLHEGRGHAGSIVFEDFRRRCGEDACSPPST